MKLTQAIKMALSSILSTKLRSFLTMLGIIIGVLSVTLLVSIVQSTTNNVNDTLSSLGGNVISASITSKRSSSITTSDLETLENNMAVDSVSPIVSGSGTAKASSNSSSVTITGITPEYQKIKEYTLTSGREILDVDNENRLQVCVIGATVAEDLFGRADVAGEKIKVSGRTFNIVGVIEEEGSSQMNSNDTMVYIPFKTAQRVLKSTTISSFYVSASSEDTLKMAETVVNSYLLQKTGDEDSYTVQNQADIADSVSDVTTSLSYMLGGIAGISLLVGGIGIMNIMLVSVTERTKEIGIRKAIGAKKKDILWQFMIESVVLSFMGGLTGVLLSIIILAVANIFVSTTLTLSVAISVFSLGFSIVVGIIFGLYPANKAAKLKPIDALHFE
ncbi:MAG: ABC transporter permease [Anaerostipes sp.]|nr:ABC transporter permease [Anaerostipes sp.]MDD3745113.1 ABC transporter permease [Anaerostipes sp.]